MPATIARLCETPPLSRRNMLLAGGALFGATYLPRLAHAASGRDPRLIVIVLRGALDDEIRLGELDEIQRQAQVHNPEIKALQSQVEKAQSQQQAARASRWPGVEVRYTESTDVELRHGTLGVQVQIPLLDQRSGPMAEAAAELERARIRLEGRQAEMRQQVLQAWKSLEMARLRVEALGQGAMREAEAALRVAQAAYRFGERGILDVLDAQRVLQSVRADLLDARYQVQAARIDLDYLAGRYAEDNL